MKSNHNQMASTAICFHTWELCRGEKLTGACRQNPVQTKKVEKLITNQYTHTHTPLNGRICVWVLIISGLCVLWKLVDIMFADMINGRHFEQIGEKGRHICVKETRIHNLKQHRVNMGQPDSHRGAPVLSRPRGLWTSFKQTRKDFGPYRRDFCAANAHADMKEPKNTYAR